MGFQIYPLGQATGCKVTRGIGGGEKALRVARTVPANQWLPARTGSWAVECELPLNFWLAQ